VAAGAGRVDRAAALVSLDAVLEARAAAFEARPLLHKVTCGYLLWKNIFFFSNFTNF
jgi:hypothetical protein